MPKTLLLADDSVVIQKLVGLSFANEDVELVTTDNGDDALTRARELRPDLVLADVVMPGKNGYEVCQAIKSDPDLGTTPVLLLTGTFEAFDEDRARTVGSDGHITKPFEAQGLVDRVTDLLSRPRPAAAPPQAPAATPAPPATPAAAAAPTPAPPEAPQAAAAAPAAAAPTSGEGDDAYDFFDDDVQELAGPDLASPPASTGNTDSFEFGNELDDLATSDPDTLDTGFDLDSSPSGPVDPADLTVLAPNPISPALSPTAPDATAPDATRVDMGETMIAEDFGPPTPAPVASLDAQLETPPPAPAPPAASAQATPEPAETMVADDLFADPIPTGPTPPPVPTAPATPPTAPPAVPIEPPVAESTSAPDPMPAMDSGFAFDAEPAPPAPARADALDDITSPSAAESGLGIDDAADPLASMAAREAAPDLVSWDASEASDPGPADAAESTRSGYDVSMSDLGDPLAASSPEATPPPVPAEPAIPETPSPAASDASPAPAPEPIALADTGSMPKEMSPAMRDQIHETLEKVAWEAFADVSDTIVKQVLQRVESIVWEVVPQMAEALIQEEIRRMKGED